MVLSVNKIHANNINFGAKKDDNAPEHDMRLENTLAMRSRIALHKFTKAFTVYPARGITGNINSDFYEFLTMGIVPYVVGSLTLMGVFNGVRHAFKISENAKAAKLGNKMALGVLFYGAFSTLSKNLITYPVKWITGVDSQLPYLKVYNELPENKEDTDLVSYEYHKVGESVEFTRWDMLYGKPQNKKDLNEKFDKIAKLNRMGKDLNDSDQSVKPMYKEVLVKSTLAKSFASYFWAATGVVMAFQKPWEEFFNAANFNIFKPKEFWHTVELFGRDFVKSAKSLYKGNPEATSQLSKHAGKGLIGITLATTVLGLLNTLNINSKPSKVKDKDVLNNNKESVVA